MSRVLGSLVVSTVLTSVAMAQPYAPAPAPQPYPPPQPYAPQPYAPQPYAYQPQVQVQLSAEDAEILNRGPITESAHIGGGLVALFFGFGIGQAVQGRYGDTGWIFTVGELGSGALMIYGLVQLIDDCYGYDYECNDTNRSGGAGPLIVGALALTGFRIWEVVDAFAGPASHNRRYKNVQMRVQGYAPPQWGIYSARTMDRQATVTGLELRF
ncbi:MAG: hypothetical protein ACKV2T_18760 [Kofleriaceae bacterium]